MSLLRRFFRRRPKVEPIRTHGLAIFWYDHGCPSEYGDEITVDMRSGKKAIFKLVGIERATGCDWNWYDFDFVRYV